MKENRKADDPNTPTINKSLPIMKCTEAFHDHLHRCVGARMIPLAYVIQDDEAVPGPCPPLKTDQPFSEKHGLAEEDLVHRASHGHVLYKADNASVYFKLEEATRGTPQTDSISTSRRKKYGRGAFMELMSQYYGSDKWDSVIKKQGNILHSRKWKGQGNFSLESFVQMHRSAYVSMKATCQHVDYQLLNEHTRVTYLLDSLESDDAVVQAAMASIKGDNNLGGNRTDFERAAAHLLPEDPVQKKHLTDKRPAADI